MWKYLKYQSRSTFSAKVTIGAERRLEFPAARVKCILEANNEILKNLQCITSE